MPISTLDTIIIKYNSDGYWMAKLNSVYLTSVGSSPKEAVSTLPADLKEKIRLLERMEKEDFLNKEGLKILTLSKKLLQEWDFLPVKRKETYI